MYYAIELSLDRCGGTGVIHGDALLADSQKRLLNHLKLSPV